MRPDPRYLEFFALWNRRRFYECHEVLEEIWVEAEGDERVFYQGLIQAAGAFVHLERRNLGPCGRLLQSALEKLEDLPPRFMGFELREFVELLETWQARVELMDVLDNWTLTDDEAPVLTPPPAPAAETDPDPRMPRMGNPRA